MLNYLNIKTAEKKKGIKKLINLLRRDKITVQIKSSRGVCVKQVTYESLNGNVDLNRLENIFRYDKDKLLCGEDIIFPKSSGFARFDSLDFRIRLCTNMALAVLKNCKYPDKLNVGIFDESGESADILFHVLNICNNVRVVTQNEESYYFELDRALNELGATAMVTKNADDLSDCDFVIICGNIERQLPLRQDALVLASACPKQKQNGILYYKYYPKVPNVFESVKPKGLDGEYFCSALYTLEHQYQLGSIVPLLCSGNSSAQTPKSLGEYLNLHCESK